jgi:hypothetical protein
LQEVATVWGASLSRRILHCKSMAVISTCLSGDSLDALNAFLPSSSAG